MIGDFTFENPTKIIFGEHALDALSGELQAYGDRVLLIYGGGSIKRNGIYDQVMEQLKGKTVTEFAGVKSNPTVETLREGTKIVKACDADFVLAVGGGSVCDTAKAVAASKGCPVDPWDFLYVKNQDPDWEILPVGCVTTMVGTGSDMNSVAVLMDTETRVKKGHHFASSSGYPRFSILNPRFSMTLPHYQMVSGIFDAFNHLSEQYFAGFDRNPADYMIEGLMRAIIDDSRAALKDPQDYEARSNLMWSATWALNDLFKKGNYNDWMIHKIGQTVATFTDAAHGMSLSAVTPAYYRLMVPYGLEKFCRFARNVWNIDGAGLTDEELAFKGLEAMESWMKELGVVMDLHSLGVTQDMIGDIVDATPRLDTGYKELTREELRGILEASF